MPSAALGASASASPSIVQLRSGAALGDVLRMADKRLGIKVAHKYSKLMRGFSAALTDAQRRTLLADPRVEAIVPDQAVRSTGDPEAEPGVRRVGSLQNLDRSGATLDVDIAILDTGIQTNNPDLNVVGGYNCTNTSQPGTYGDSPSFGHGTHVAGIAGARNNGSGVEGVAAGARLWSIKVLDFAGLGYWSWIICGLDHVADMQDPSDPSMPRIEVVNLSLAGAGSDDGNCGQDNHDLLHQAICRLHDDGVTIVAAAGNGGANANNYIPAAYDEVITVSGMADYNGQPGGAASPPSGCGSAGGVNSGAVGDDKMAGFSNYGADVDLIAPAVCVLSNLPNNRLGRMTGTSMAAPHVTGGAALYYLAEKRRGHGRPTPFEVRAGLIEVGRLDWKTGSDKGGPHEPAMYVGNLDLGADFGLSSNPQRRRASAGQTVAYDIQLARLGGFGGSPSISLTQSTLPPGASSSVGGAAGAYARVSINLGGGTQPGSYDIQIRGTSGASVATVNVRLIVEPAANGGPWMDVRLGSTTGAALPVSITWPSVANAQSYQLQRSRDGEAWSTVATTGSTSVQSTAWPGAIYELRVRTKVGGNWGSYKYGVASAVVPVYPPKSIDFSGAWSRDANFSSYGELPMYSSQAGARATVDFTGRGVAWISSKGPTRGYADVSIDGNFVERVNLYSSSSKHRQVVFSHTFAGFGQHTLVIEVVGAPASRKRVDVDTLLVVAH